METVSKSTSTSKDTAGVKVFDNLSLEKLNQRQRLFVIEFLKDRNATQAAIRSGYSKKCANIVGPRQLSNVRIKTAIDEKLEQVEKSAMVDATYVITRLREVVERCLQKEQVMEFNHETKELEPTGEWKFDSMGANSALRMLGQHLKLFTEKVEHSGSISVEELLGVTAEPKDLLAAKQN